MSLVGFFGGRGERILHRVAFLVGDVVFFALQQALVVSIDTFSGAVLQNMFHFVETGGLVGSPHTIYICLVVIDTGIDRDTFGRIVRKAE